MNINDINKLQLEVLTVAGAKEVNNRLDTLDDSECRALLGFMLNHKQLNAEFTPPSEWSIKGETDPHGSHYNRERAKIAMGGLTDDQLANAVFMGGDGSFPAISSIALLTSAKERIRWMSRSMITLLKLLLIARNRLAKYENVEVTLPVEDLDKFTDTEYQKYVRAIIGK